MKNSSTKYIILILIALILGLGTFLGVIFYRNITRDPMSAFDAPAPTTNIPQVSYAPATPVPTLSPEELKAMEEQELKDQADMDFMKNRVNILLLGWDQSPERDDEDSVLYRDEQNNFRSDVMMLLTVDFEGGDVHLISIPRDTMAKIYNTKGHWKINAAFAKGGSAAGNGFDYAIKTVENLMGVPIPYYAGVNMEGLKAVVDAMGGVDYDVDKEIVLNGRTLSTGMQHLNGQQVLDYCRARKGYGTDVDRADRQQRMLFAIFNQLQQGSKLTTLPKVYLSVKDYIYTNLTVEQIAALAVFAMDLDVENNLHRHTLEGKYINGTVYSGASFYVLDTQALKELMKEIFHVDIEVDYRYDYRYVDGEKAAFAGLSYAAAAQYLCSLTGRDLNEYQQGYRYGYPYDELAQGGLELQQLCFEIFPDAFEAVTVSAVEESDSELLDGTELEFEEGEFDLDESSLAMIENIYLSRELINERVASYSQILYDYCIRAGICREHVDRQMLPSEFYKLLPSMADLERMTAY